MNCQSCFFLPRDVKTSKPQYCFQIYPSIVCLKNKLKPTRLTFLNKLSRPQNNYFALERGKKKVRFLRRWSCAWIATQNAQWRSNRGKQNSSWHVDYGRYAANMRSVKNPVHSTSKFFFCPKRCLYLRSDRFRTLQETHGFPSFLESRVVDARALWLFYMVQKIAPKRALL